MTVRRTIAAAAIAAATVLAAAPASAEEGLSVSVSYADLNIASAKGRSALDHRIAAAIGVVCGDADVRDLRGMTLVAACRSQAQAGVKTQLARIESGRQLASLDVTALPR